MSLIDLRSDTVTQPTLEMRDAMATAEVGDDVYGEDPTINQLQIKSAELMGMEAGLFVPSGTMGNLIAVLCHCLRGDEAIMGDKGHTFLFEAGGISALGGVFAHTLINQPDGTIRLEDIKNAIRPDDLHQPPSKLLILENTQNRCGGVVLTQEYVHSTAQLIHQNGMKLHIDGARIFNASVALKTKAIKLVDTADSITFCLSKGLCAPVGSVLCGNTAFINQARRLRKMLGGGMRQAGVMAAAGLVAINKMIDRLEDDHHRALLLADELAKIPGLRLDLGLPQTNMVFLTLEQEIKGSARQIAQKLADMEIKVGLTGERSFRLVTHAMIGDEDISRTIQGFRNVIR